MCFIKTSQFPRPIKAKVDIPAKKKVLVVFTRRQNGVDVVMQSPWQKQQYRQFFVPRHEVFQRVEAPYDLDIEMPHVTLRHVNNAGVINEGYHSYFNLRMTETSYTRIVYNASEPRRIEQCSIEVPAVAYIPQGTRFYMNHVDGEYVSEQIYLSIQPDNVTIAEEALSYGMHTVFIDSLLALVAYRVLYNRSAEWYDRELKKLEQPNNIF